MVPIALSFILLVVLLFFDGLIFGIAAAKGVVSIILIIVGLILASFIGLTVPALGGTNYLSYFQTAFMNMVNRYGPSFFAMPIFWIIGFVVGLFVV